MISGGYCVVAFMFGFNSCDELLNFKDDLRKIFLIFTEYIIVKTPYFAVFAVKNFENYFMCS